MLILHYQKKYFNPHSHTGSDRWDITATSHPVYFNPHSHTGSDSILFPQYCPMIHFNPHSHTGSDCFFQKIFVVNFNFNPHSHTGSDYIQDNELPVRTISIHTPIQGVTDNGRVIKAEIVISIHTPIQGVTSEWVDDALEEMNFNPHSHTGSDSDQRFYRP